MRAIGGENPVKSSQVDPRLGHQRDKTGDEVGLPVSGNIVLFPPREDEEGEQDA